MWIKLTKEGYERRHEVVRDLFKKLSESRFTARIDEDWCSRVPYGIKVETVRLKERSDHYCGQHPGPCRAGNRTSNFGKKGAFYLEGLDWVAWNDMLNDVLDALNIEADVWSYNREALGGRFYIRKGFARRICYDSLVQEAFGREFENWAEATEDDFLNCIGATKPKTIYARGTPGTYEWRANGQDKETTGTQEGLDRSVQSAEEVVSELSETV